MLIRITMTIRKFYKPIQDIQYRYNEDGSFSEIQSATSEMYDGSVFKYSFKERLIILIDYLRLIKFSKEFRSIETKLSFGRFGSPTIFVNNKNNFKSGTIGDFNDIKTVIELLKERGWL